MSDKNTEFNLEPYLSFEGRCEEAIEFYQKSIGAEVVRLVRFKDAPDNSMCAPGKEDKIMHASLRIGNGALMASDGRCGGTSALQGFSLALTVPADTDAERVFAALSEGGKVQMPLAKTFFSPRFGMVQDKFGVTWMVRVA